MDGHPTCIITLGLRDDVQARNILTSILLACDKIIRSHSWKVVEMKEFLPRSDALLGRNTNRGELIEVRLHRDRNDYRYVTRAHRWDINVQFLPFRVHSGDISARARSQFHK